MAKQTVPLYTVSTGERVSRARASLAGALAGAEIGVADESGGFDVTLVAGSSGEAEERVREALASSGTGDDFVLRGSITGREMPADDPRQPEGLADEADEEPPAPSPDERARGVADAADRVASAARRMANATPGPVEEAAAKLAEEAPKRVADATQKLADEGPAAAAAAAERVQGADWRRLAAPIGAGVLALIVIGRLRRR